jgi:hypothetical protein
MSCSRGPAVSLTERRACEACSVRRRGVGEAGHDLPEARMSKKTSKRKTKARKSKANHGTKPNAGR